LSPPLSPARDDVRINTEFDNAWRRRSNSVRIQQRGGAAHSARTWAWVILYAPMVVALVSVHRIKWLPAILLVIAVTGVYLARHALALIIRRRDDPGTPGWLAVYVMIAAAGAIPLLAWYRVWPLIEVGLGAAVLFGIHAALIAIPARKRLDRSQWGEILAVSALTLTAPAVYAVADSRLDARALVAWVGCTLYFASGIFFVKMLLASVKVKGTFTWPDRWRVGRDHVLFHALLVALLVVGAVVCAPRAPLAVALVVAGYLPALYRAAKGWVGMSGHLPPLKKVGMGETVYAVWFAVFCGWALHVGL
jgi:uncharacterized membrane protein YhaH (DUF805 family)